MPMVQFYNSNNKNNNDDRPCVESKGENVSERERDDREGVSVGLRGMVRLGERAGGPREGGEGLNCMKSKVRDQIPGRANTDHGRGRVVKGQSCVNAVLYI